MPFLLRDSTGHEFPIRGETHIGRASTAQVVITDPCASGLHATIWEQQGRLFLRDEDSRNGTLVNGNRIQQITLRDEDLIRIGNTTLTVVYYAQRSPELTIPLPHSRSGAGRKLSLSASTLIIAGGTLLVCLILFGGFFWRQSLAKNGAVASTPGTPQSAILGRVLQQPSEQAKLLTPAEFTTQNEALAQAIAGLNWAEIKFIDSVKSGAGTLDEDLCKIAAQATLVANVAESLGKTAVAQDNGSAVAGEIAAPYFSIARLGYGLVLETHNLREGLQSSGLPPAAAADKIAEYGARLWNPLVAASGGKDNPFFQWVKDPANLTPVQFLDSGALAQLGPGKLQTWLAATQDTLTLTIALPQPRTAISDPFANDLLATLTTPAGQADADRARQVSVAHLAMLTPALSALTANETPAQQQITVLRGAAMSGAAQMAAGSLPTFAQGTAIGGGAALELYKLSGPGQPQLTGSASLKEVQPLIKLSITAAGEISRWKNAQEMKGISFEVQVKWESSLDAPQFELGCLGGTSLPVSTASGSRILTAATYLASSADSSAIYCRANRPGDLAPSLGEVWARVTIQ
jgi:hypothetical protein